MVEFGHTLDINGRELVVDVQADGKVYTHLYGADADGNRGEWRTELDDLEVTVKDARGNDITDKLEKKYEREFQKLLDAAEEKLFEAYYERQEQ